MFQNKNGTPNIQSPIASVPVKKMVHFSTPKPFQPSNLPPVVPSASLTEQIRQQAAKASADEVPFDFPPPPPELLEPLESPGKPMPPPPEFVESPEKVPPPPASNPPQSRDPLFGFLDFLDDDKEAKKLPGGLSHLFYPETSSTLHQSHLALHRRRILSVSRKFRPDRLNSAHLAFPMAPSAC